MKINIVILIETALLINIIKGINILNPSLLLQILENKWYVDFWVFMVGFIFYCIVGSYLLGDLFENIKNKLSKGDKND